MSARLSPRKTQCSNFERSSAYADGSRAKMKTRKRQRNASFLIKHLSYKLEYRCEEGRRRGITEAVGVCTNVGALHLFQLQTRHHPTPVWIAVR